MPLKMNPTSRIISRLGLEPNGPVEKFFASTCAKHMDKYVPMDEGNLRQYKLEGNLIIYEQPYAQYQYYGIRRDGTRFVRNYTTPGTGPYWDERMISAEMKSIEVEVQRFINDGGK